MSTLQDLIAQREAIDQKIAEIKRLKRSEAISQALTLIAENDLTQNDLFGGVSDAKKVKATVKVAAKYRDPISGNEWSGRGMTPKWIAESGKDKSEFLIG